MTICVACRVCQVLHTNTIRATARHLTGSKHLPVSKSHISLQLKELDWGSALVVIGVRCSRGWTASTGTARPTLSAVRNPLVVTQVDTDARTDRGVGGRPVQEAHGNERPQVCSSLCRAAGCFLARCRLSTNEARCVRLIFNTTLNYDNMYCGDILHGDNHGIWMDSICGIVGLSCSALYSSRQLSTLTHVYVCRL